MKQRAWLGLVVLAGAVAAFFAYRLLMGVFFPPPWAERQPLQGWMTPGFVARMYQVPPRTLDPVLQLDEDARRRVTLEQIAADQGVPLDTLLERIDAIVKLHEMIRG